MADVQGRMTGDRITIPREMQGRRADLKYKDTQPRPGNVEVLRGRTVPIRASDDIQPSPPEKPDPAKKERATNEDAPSPPVAGGGKGPVDNIGGGGKQTGSDEPGDWDRALERLVVEAVPVELRSCLKREVQIAIAADTDGVMRGALDKMQAFIHRLDGDKREQFRNVMHVLDGETQIAFLRNEQVLEPLLRNLMTLRHEERQFLGRCTSEVQQTFLVNPEYMVDQMRHWCTRPETERTLLFQLQPETQFLLLSGGIVEPDYFQETGPFTRIGLSVLAESITEGRASQRQALLDLPAHVQGGILFRLAEGPGTCETLLRGVEVYARMNEHMQGSIIEQNRHIAAEEIRILGSLPEYTRQTLNALPGVIGSDALFRACREEIDNIQGMIYNLRRVEWHDAAVEVWKRMPDTMRFNLLTDSPVLPERFNRIVSIIEMPTLSHVLYTLNSPAQYALLDSAIIKPAGEQQAYLIERLEYIMGREEPLQGAFAVLERSPLFKENELVGLQRGRVLAIHLIEHDVSVWRDAAQLMPRVLVQRLQGIVALSLEEQKKWHRLPADLQRPHFRAERGIVDIPAYLASIREDELRPER